MSYIQENLQDFTRLPLRMINLLDGNRIAIFIKTPHKGQIELQFKERINGFFGPKGEVTKTGKELIDEISKLETDARDFLLDEWIKKNE